MYGKGKRAGWIMIRMLLMVMCGLFSAVYAEAAAQIEVLPTYGQGDFVWSKAGVDNSPNILSELTWRGLRSRGVQGVLRSDLNRDWYIEAAGEYGLFYAGANQDSDYFGDNRTGEYSRSNNSGSGGHVFTASLAVGRRLEDDGAGRTRMLAGYAYSRQTLTITDGFQTIPATGSFDGLNSEYRAVWAGPWIGLEHRRQTGKRLNVTGRVEYHLPSYTGEARWNLRSDLEQPVTNNHWAHGSGIRASLGLDYDAGSRWRLGVHVDYARHETGYGTDQVNISSGDKIRVRLNEAVWQSWACRVSANYRF